MSIRPSVEKLNVIKDNVNTKQYLPVGCLENVFKIHTFFPNHLFWSAFVIAA